jgi:hypothetical protein
MATLNELSQAALRGAIDQLAAGNIRKFRENEDSAEYNGLDDVADLLKALASPEVTAMLNDQSGPRKVFRTIGYG